MSNNNTTKKRSSFASCSACRAQHCACDEVRPCNRCARLGIPCTEGISRKAKLKQPQYQLDVPSVNSVSNSPFPDLEKEFFLERPELHFQPTYTNIPLRATSTTTTFLSAPPQPAIISPQQSQPAPFSKAMNQDMGYPVSPSSFTSFYPMMMQTYALAPHPMMSAMDLPGSMCGITSMPTSLSHPQTIISSLSSSLPASTLISPVIHSESASSNPLNLPTSPLNISTTLANPSISPSISPSGSPLSPTSYLSTPESDHLNTSPPTESQSPLIENNQQSYHTVSPHNSPQQQLQQSPPHTQQQQQQLPLHQQTIAQQQIPQQTTQNSQQPQQIMHQLMQQQLQQSIPAQPLQLPLLPQQSQQQAIALQSQQQQQPQQPLQQQQQQLALQLLQVTNVQKLEKEVEDLKHELWLARQKQTNTFPFLSQVQPRSLAMSLWRMPEGELVDFSAGFHAMLCLNVYDRITFDLISPKELKIERANLWSFFAREKPALSGIVTKKPLVTGRGEKIVPLSMCSLIHFGDTTLLQCTFWLN